MKSCIILIFLVALAFANSLQNQFVWDDTDLIVNNPNIDLPIKEIPSIFATPLWKMAGFSEGEQVYYRPIVSLLFVLNYKIWGFNPLGFHLTNILLHLISVIVLYKIGLLLFNNDTKVSFIGASIFAVHPVNNEPVGRAASGEVIFGFFIILSIYFFLKEKRYLSWITFFLALLSKETAAMLPFALVILSTDKQGFKKGMAKIIPYIVLIGIYLVARITIVDIILGDNLSHHIFIQIFTMATATLDYIRLLIIPYPLSPFYPARWFTSVNEPKVIIAIITLILISLFAFKIRKDRTLLFLLASPFIMLLPVIWRVNAFAAGEDLIYIAERFLYVPAMLFSVFISAFTLKLVDENRKKYIAFVLASVMVVFSIITMNKNAVWKDNSTLFQKIISNTPDAAFANIFIGNTYANQGHFDKAIQKYLLALRLNPHNAIIHNNLGNAYSDQGRFDDAVKEYLIALRRKPDYADAHYNLGIVYLRKGLKNEAMREFETVLKLKPDDHKSRQILESTK